MDQISAITPFFRGNLYINRLADCLEANAQKLFQGMSSDDKTSLNQLEWVIVNDSPDCQVELKGKWDHLKIKVINLPENGGIHHARIEGLKHAQGNLILFIDQDDGLDPGFLSKQKKILDNTSADVVVCGALLEKPDGTTEPIYRKKADLEDITRLDIYLKVKDPIRSPGQCLIRRSAIPDCWCQNPMKVNGADDLLLWIMMLSRNTRFAVVPDCLYTHRYTGGNVSASIPHITASSMEVVEHLKKTGMLTRQQLDDLKHSVEWGGRTSKENRRYYLKNPRIFWARLRHKLDYAVSAPIE